MSSESYYYYNVKPVVSVGLVKAPVVKVSPEQQLNLEMVKLAKTLEAGKQ